jgi:hypothetical protein
MGKFNVGDRVYHPRHGIGSVLSNQGIPYPIKVVFDDSGLIEHYERDGRKREYDVNPILLTIEESRAKGYDVPKVTRKVTKTVSRWANVYGSAGLANCSYETREEADANATGDARTACVELTGTYEVEEEV